MSLPEECLSIVEQWKKKSIEMSSEFNDSIVTLLGKSIDTMCVVLNKKSDLKRVERALVSLESERLVSLQFDDLRNDEIRSLVYGHISCLHFTLSELTKERKQVKECGDLSTQTEEELSQPLLAHSLLSDQIKDSAEMFTQCQINQETSQPSLDPLSSNEYADQSRDEPIIPNLLEYPKEEIFDESSIKIEDLWEDAVEIKDEEIPNDNEINSANEDMAGDRRDVSNVVHNNDMAQSEMPALDYMGDESHFENEDVDKTMDGLKDNEIMGEDKDSSETFEVKNKRRSSRNVSKPVKFADSESLDYSDEDFEPSTKKMDVDSSKRKIIATSSDVSVKKGRPLTTGTRREMKCTECEYQTTSAATFTHHLRFIHSTTLELAGLALRCDCGVEFQSKNHKFRDKCEIANFTVVRKRDGPIHRIKDEKTTPQCLLCEEYPTTAYGYIAHLRNYHNSTLIRLGIFLLCKCGAKYRQNHPDSNHTKECTRREFTLHKVADK